jgi:hypothetical protein
MSMLAQVGAFRIASGAVARNCKPARQPSGHHPVQQAMSQAYTPLDHDIVPFDPHLGYRYMNSRKGGEWNKKGSVRRAPRMPASPRAGR